MINQRKEDNENRVGEKKRREGEKELLTVVENGQ